MAGEASCVVEIGEAPGSMFEAEYWKAQAQLWKEKAEQWKERSIYKVPAYITNRNPKAYLPRVVSFGPYHHDKEHPKPMEEHKERALVNFINRSGKPFPLFTEAMSKVLDDLMACYDSLDQKWRDDRDAFRHLMILDGCFMLEIMRTGTTGAVEDDAYAPDDPIFSNHGKLYIKPYVQRDMLMLENQLPILALDMLVAVESDGKKDKEFVNRLILNFLSSRQPVKKEGKGLRKLNVSRKIWHFKSKTVKILRTPIMKMDKDPPVAQAIAGMGQIVELPHLPITKMNKCLHVLDVFRKHMLPNGPTEETRTCWTSSDTAGGDNIIRSATELHEAGVQFKKSKTANLKDVSFSGGILRIPPITVDDTTESMFLNLIAFERFHVGIGNEVSSYLWFMDEIIDNNKDVALLQSRGIIENALGSDEEMAKLFNSLAKDVSINPTSSLQLVHKEVTDYSERPWNKWKANLRHTYFRNPWTIVSLIAAILLFTLTILQTTFTILPYYH